ncbi:hypothetical protein BpHYR1_007208 [Brachionus plicatilis]|uniref:Uncharacterized protein n=1 Tax=Brachionus plicatilis TaxID=10195 RepID=A0A3M7SQH6_BRAPC|nr:hypothetical protein BpHYR1_007208 [Brachionus plicatilis]
MPNTHLCSKGQSPKLFKFSLSLRESKLKFSFIPGNSIVNGLVIAKKRGRKPLPRDENGKIIRKIN